MANSKVRPEAEVQPVKDYYDKYGAHIRIFPPVGTKEDQERARARYIQIATEIQVRRAMEALAAVNATPEILTGDEGGAGLHSREVPVDGGE